MLIGSLSTLQHDVSGTVYAVNTRTLLIENFNYDGSAFAVFWINTDPSASSDGQAVPFSDCTISNQLPRYDDQTVELELPDGLTISDIRYLSVWCLRFVEEFGGIEVNAASLDNVPVLAAPTCSEQPMSIPVRDNWNCEQLSPDYQVRWQLTAPNINFELVSRLGGEARYMGFGPSGSETTTQMIGSDAVIASRSGTDFSAVDYHMNAQSQCADAEGVCPDTDPDRDTPGANHVTAVSGEFTMNLTVVRYTRPLEAQDDVLDLTIRTDSPQFVVWALGPLNPDGLPLFHGGDMAFPGAPVSINFGRTPTNNCSVITTDAVSPEENVPGFIRPVLSNVTAITARIGPSGNARGVRGIRSMPSWGIAWYLSETGSTGEDVLIPVLGVERGKTYTFSVYGGLPADTGTHHPFYITSNDLGGYENLSPKQRSEETVYAGINVTSTDADDGVTAYTATAQGQLCQFTTDLTPTEVNGLETYDQYYDSFNTSCASDASITDNPGTLEWTVAADTPDEVFYQCVTHQSLGYIIRVFDEGMVDERELQSVSGGGPLNGADCKASYNGVEVNYANCQKGLTGGIDVFWNIRSDDGEIDTLFRATDTVGYVGFGWGYNSMVDAGESNVAAVFNGDSGPMFSNYALTERAVAGVRPSPSAALTKTGAEKTAGFVTAVFTRKLVVDGLPSLSADTNNVAIWASGSATGASAFEYHDTNRAFGELASAPTPSPAPRPTPAAGAPRNCTASFNGVALEFQACQTGLDGNVDVFWNINNGEIDTLFRAPDTVGYVGFGWGYTSMTDPGGSNAAAVFNGDSGAVFNNYHLTEKNPSGVRQSPTPALSKTGAETAGGFVTGMFTRELIAAGLPDLIDGENIAIWASGSATSASAFVNHGPPNRGRGGLSGSGNSFSEPVRTIFQIHGAFMGISWLILVPLAITTMRYFKKFNPATFQIHRAVNSLAVILTTAAFIMALVEANRTEIVHLTIGCVVFALAIIQVIAGAARPDKGTSARKPWYFAHAIFGSLAVTLGIVNSFLGIDTNRIRRSFDDGNPTIWFALAGVAVGLFVLANIALSVMPAKFPTKEPEMVPEKSDTREGRDPDMP